MGYRALAGYLPCQQRGKLRRYGIDFCIRIGEGEALKADKMKCLRILGGRAESRARDRGPNTGALIGTSRCES